MPELRYQELNLMQMLDVLRTARLARLALADGHQPYVVPLCYQLEVARGQIVIHLSMPEQGRKVDILRRNALACLEFELPSCAWVDVVVLEGRAAVGMQEPGRGMDVCIQAVSMTGRRYFAAAE